MNKGYLLALVSGLCLGTSLISAASNDGRIWYSDFDNNKVYAIDVPTMSVVGTAETGAGPYPVDIQRGQKIYATTRNEQSIDVINIFSSETMKTIPLEHKPRSATYNPVNGLSLVSGKDKPLTSVINVRNNQVVQVVGSDTYVAPIDFGGSNATGHPFWVDDTRFLMLDRTNRTIQMYDIDGNFLDSMNTPSAAHHILRKGSEYYASTEGSPNNGIHPALISFDIIGDDLNLVDTTYLTGFPVSEMGSHHADFAPDGTHVYMGSNEGHMFVIDRHTMSVANVIDAGLGAGHTKFSPNRDLAIVTNHNDSFITLIDTTTHTKIRDVTVAAFPTSARKSQGHTATVSPEGGHYYGSASAEGRFFEVDLDNENVSRTLNLGSYTLQGAVYWGKLGPL